MDNLINSMLRALSQMAETSWQALILVSLVVLLIVLLRKQLSARWRAALWLIIVARLLMPIGPKSPVSLFNYFYSPTKVACFYFPDEDVSASAALPSTKASTPSEPTAEKRPVSSSKVARSTAPTSKSASRPSGKVSRNDSVVPAVLATVPQKTLTVETPAETGSCKTDSQATAARPVDRTVWLIVGLVWVAGIFLFALHMFFVMFRLHLLLRRCDPVENRSIQRLFDAARRELGIRRRVQLLSVPVTLGPAVTGIFRPKLILARSLFRSLTDKELRLIFLHELSHIRRQDLLVQQLWRLAKILHWFNPIVWFAAHQWQTDRELACDEAILARLEPSHRPHYGYTILRVMESLASFRKVPGTVGILTRRHFLIYRIALITRYRPLWRGWAVLAAGLLLLLIPLGLTDATGRPTLPPPQKPVPQTVAPVIDFTPEKGNVFCLSELESNNVFHYAEEIQKHHIRKIRLPEHTTDSLLKQCADTGILSNASLLDLKDCEKVKDLTPLKKARKLSTLSLPPATTNQQLNELRQKKILNYVAHLDLRNCTKLTSLSPLSGLKRLRTLDASGCTGLTDISVLPKLKNLEVLVLNAKSLKNIRVLSNLKTLKSLSLFQANRMTNTSIISRIRNLEALYLSDCSRLRDVSSLKKLKKLKSVTLIDCRNVRNLSVLSSLKLNELVLEGCDRANSNKSKQLTNR